MKSLLFAIAMITPAFADASSSNEDDMGLKGKAVEVQLNSPSSAILSKNFEGRDYVFEGTLVEMKEKFLVLKVKQGTLYIPREKVALILAREKPDAPPTAKAEPEKKQ